MFMQAVGFTALLILALMNAVYAAVLVSMPDGFFATSGLRRKGIEAFVFLLVDLGYELVLGAICGAFAVFFFSIGEIAVSISRMTIWLTWTAVSTLWGCGLCFLLACLVRRARSYSTRRAGGGIR